MELPTIGFNEGSLLRRTILHVATFVLGSALFIGFVSFMLVSLAQGLVSQPTTVAHRELSAAAGPLSAPLAKPEVAPRSPRRGATISATARSKDH